MNSISKCTIKLFNVIVAIFVIAGLLFTPTTLAMAQDENPPAPAETGEGGAPASGGEEIPPPDQAAQPPAEDPPAGELAPVELPPVQTVEAPIEPAPTEVFPVEQTVEIPETVITEAAPEEPVVIEPEATAGVAETVITEAAPEAPASVAEEAAAEALPAETVEEIVAVMDENNTILVDSNNEEIPLASEAAAQALEGADPFFLDPISGTFIGYTSGGTCPAFVGECHTGVTAPFMAAFNDTRLTDYSTLYIEAATYNEPDIILNRNINLQGGTGWTTSGSGSTLTVGFTNAIATINSLTLSSNIGFFNNVVANTVFVNGNAVATDVERGYLLDDALWVVNTGGTINVSDGTYQDEGDGFLIEKNGVTLQGQGDGAIINGSNTGYGIYVDDYISGTVLHDVTVRRIKVIGSNYGISIGDAQILTFDRVTLTGNTTGLYASAYAGPSEIHNSIILGNTSYGIYNGSTATIDASGNYWGHALGPTLCWDAGGVVTCESTKKGDFVYSIDGTNRTVITDGFLTRVICPPGQFDSNSDDVCDVTSCPAGSFDANSDGACEATTCAAGSFDRNSDGLCENTVCAAGSYDRNSDGVCEKTTCSAGTFDANSDGVCETTVCAAGSYDANSDGACEKTTCTAGFFDANSDGVCEKTTCAAGAFDANSDGVCETTACLPGTYDRNSDGACEKTTCTAGSFDANSDGVCEATVCTAGRFDANSDGVCEITVCAAGTNDMNSDGKCEPTTCPPGSADVNSNGTCVPTVCASLTYDANSDSVCETTVCAPGSADVNSDGACEAVACAPGFFDTDSDNVCEAMACPAGSYDANSDGACETTICPTDLFDMDSDGKCEAINCGPGFSDANSDGYCEETLCKGGLYDTDSDGFCEDVGFSLPAAIPAGGGAIPVTGGMQELSCTEANTLIVTSGHKISFSAPLCGYLAGLNEESLTALPGPLPEGMIFITGMSLVMQKDAADVSILPEPVTASVSFAVPAEFSDKTLVILRWDPSSNSWVEVSSAGATGLTTPGIYVLAYK